MTNLGRYMGFAVGVILLGCSSDTASPSASNASGGAPDLQASGGGPAAGGSSTHVPGTGGSSVGGASAGGGNVGGVGGLVSGSGGSSGADASTPDAGPTHDPFNGNCATAKWTNVSDACWNCYCTTCAATLDKCNDDCFKGWDCGIKNKVAVGVSAEFPCEGRAFTALCESDPVIKAASSLVSNFDTCLIKAYNPATEHARACEAACGETYSGDVCQRFPAP